MNQAERAKIFAPYSALTGFGDYIQAAERERVERVILGEDAAAELDSQLRRIRCGDVLAVTYYLTDHYAQVRGAVRRICLEERYLQIGETKIPLESILHAEEGSSACTEMGAGRR